MFLSNFDQKCHFSYENFGFLGGVCPLRSSTAPPNPIHPASKFSFFYLFVLEVWITACCASLLLLINRSLDLISSYYADLLFSGWKTYIWCLFPFGFGLWMCWFTTPYLFSSLLHASFVNPYFGIPGINVIMSDVVTKFFYNNQINLVR